MQKICAPFACCVFVCAWCSLGAAAENPGIEVHAWARATPPQATSGAIYGRFIDRAGQAWRARQFNFAYARHVMVHRTIQVDDMVRMRPGKLEIPANGETRLLPGGLHIMLMGIEKPLLAGCEYTFSIEWDSGWVTEHKLRTGDMGQAEMPDGESGQCL